MESTTEHKEVAIYQRRRHDLSDPASKAGTIESGVREGKSSQDNCEQWTSSDDGDAVRTCDCAQAVFSVVITTGSDIRAPQR
jgi:hypothetical protein